MFLRLLDAIVVLSQWSWSKFKMTKHFVLSFSSWQRNMVSFFFFLIDVWQRGEPGVGVRISFADATHSLYNTHCRPTCYLFVELYDDIISIIKPMTVTCLDPHVTLFFFFSFQPNLPTRKQLHITNFSWFKHCINVSSYVDRLIHICHLLWPFLSNVISNYRSRSLFGQKIRHGRDKSTQCERVKRAVVYWKLLRTDFWRNLRRLRV